MIRALVLAALLAPSVASAGVIATAENEAGGKIMLTDVHGACKEDWTAFSRSSNGDWLGGCWYPLGEGMLIVKWTSGNSKMYLAEDFDYIEEALDGI